MASSCPVQVQCKPATPVPFRVTLECPLSVIFASCSHTQLNRNEADFSSSMPTSKCVDIRRRDRKGDTSRFAGYCQSCTITDKSSAAQDGHHSPACIISLRTVSATIPVIQAFHQALQISASLWTCICDPTYQGKLGQGQLGPGQLGMSNTILARSEYKLCHANINASIHHVSSQHGAHGCSYMPLLLSRPLILTHTSWADEGI